MAGGHSLSPLTGPAGSVQRAIEYAQMNAEALKETPTGMTRAGVAVRGTPSPGGTKRFAGEAVIQAFERSDLMQAAGPSVGAFMHSYTNGMFSPVAPASPSGGTSAPSAERPREKQPPSMEGMA
jgi:hypothetical protein